MYLACSIYYWYGEIKLTLVLSLFSTIFYFISGSYSVYSQFKELHKVNISNEKLANEMKRLLEVFPESVFIASKNLKTQQQSVWTNYQFEQNICKVKESINELNKVLVRVNANDELEESKEYVAYTLDKLIYRHQGSVSSKMSNEWTENIEVGISMLNNCVDKKDKVTHNRLNGFETEDHRLNLFRLFSFLSN